MQRESLNDIYKLHQITNCYRLSSSLFKIHTTMVSKAIYRVSNTLKLFTAFTAIFRLQSFFRTRGREYSRIGLDFEVVQLINPINGYASIELFFAAPFLDKCGLVW